MHRKQNKKYDVLSLYIYIYSNMLGYRFWVCLRGKPFCPVVSTPSSRFCLLFAKLRMWPPLTTPFRSMSTSASSRPMPPSTTKPVLMPSPNTRCRKLRWSLLLFALPMLCQKKKLPFESFEMFLSLDGTDPQKIRMGQVPNSQKSGACPPTFSSKIWDRRTEVCGLMDGPASPGILSGRSFEEEKKHDTKCGTPCALSVKLF